MGEREILLSRLWKVTRGARDFGWEGRQKNEGLGVEG